MSVTGLMIKYGDNVIILSYARWMAMGDGGREGEKLHGGQIVADDWMEIRISHDSQSSVVFDKCIAI